MKKKFSFILFFLLVSFLSQAQPTIEIQKLLPNDGTSPDKFGFPVSISGDYAIIGAHAHDFIGNGSTTGTAYIFHNNAGTWEQVAQLTATNPAAPACFGYAVAIYDDVAVVGAFGDDINGDYSGSAYVFEKPAGGWTDMTETAMIYASDGIDWDFFGWKVAITEEYIAVGARNAIGAVYVYEKPAGGWTTTTQTAKLFSSDGQIDDEFGSAMAISGNVLLIGAYGDNNYTGSAYIFEKPAGGWMNMSETAKLTLSNGEAGSFFGYSTDISNDNIVIGAHKENGETGSAYIFEKPTSGWANNTETAKLTASDGEPGEGFGYSVSISDNYVLAGAINGDGNCESSGAAYVYIKPQSGWTNITETNKLTASDGEYEDKFGCSVCIKGDLAIIGASGDDDNGNISGSAYIFGPTALSIENDILAFDFENIEEFSVNVDDINHTVNVEVPDGTNVAALTPEILISENATINPESGTTQDFTQPFVYTVTAENGDEQEWTVTVDIISLSNDITSFQIPEQIGETIIDAQLHTILVEVPEGTNVAALTPEILISENATINPESGTTQDFTQPFVYTVTAENGDEQEWTVTVDIISLSNDITSFQIPEQTGETIIDAQLHTILVEVPEGTNVTALTPEIIISENATVNPESGTTQDFTQPFVYTVTAENGDEQEWTVTVDILSGIFSKNLNGFNIYPNPSNGIFTISGYRNILGLEITDITAKTIYTSDISNSQDEIKIDLSNQPKGIYFIKIETETLIYTEKVIIK